MYPLLAYLLGDPVVAKWGLDHGALAPMPPEAERRAQRIGRYLWILRYLVLCSYIFYVMHRSGVSLVTARLNSHYLIRSLGGGISVGVLFLLVRKSGSSLWPGLSFENPRHPVLTGSLIVWLLIVVLGSFSEELWRAFCLIALHNASVNALFAMVITSVVFALSQLGGRPSRISSTPEEVCFTALVGFGFAASLLASRSLLFVLTASIIYHVSALYLLRGHGVAE